jgi:hypothetical protein
MAELTLHRTKLLVIIALFGAIIAITKVFLPFPADKMFIIIESVLLATSALMIRRFGATYVGVIGGILAAFLRPALGLFAFLFAVLYGVLIDVSFSALKVHSKEKVKLSRMVVALAISTGLVGFLSYYTTGVLLAVLPMESSLAAPILIMGIISGAIGGYLTTVLWNKHFRRMC